MYKLFVMLLTMYCIMLCAGNGQSTSQSSPQPARPAAYQTHMVKATSMWPSR